MKQSNWPEVAVVGAGAVGSYFGAQLAKAGASVTLIGREAPMRAIRERGLKIIGKDYQETVSLQTNTKLSAASSSDLILLCIKTNDTVITAEALKQVIRPNATVLSLQNGVDNVERIYQASGLRAVPAAVYVAVELSEPGILLHKGRGDLQIGAYPFSDASGAAAADSMASAIRQISAWFEAAGVGCPVSENIEAELWTKLIMNCAVNAISALAQAPYGRMAALPEGKQMIAELVRETVMVAHVHGVKLKNADFEAAAFRLIEGMPDQYSSTAQDIGRGKLIEIDALNGYVAALARQHGVDAPLNRWLTTLIKLREQSRKAPSDHQGGTDSFIQAR